MTKPTTVVVISSISYTGTTWINCLLGCHEKGFALGPADRVVNLFETEGWAKACCVCGSECDFWPTFGKTYDPKQNFYRQLAAFSGKDFIVTNNPFTGGKAEADLHHADVLVKDLRVVRDGRAVCTSYLNHHGGSFLDAVNWYASPAARFEFDPQDEDVLCLRYEDFVADQFAMIKRVGQFLGLTYPENFYKFWEFDHHIAAGNGSIYGMIARFNRGRKFGLKAAGFYEKEFERLQHEPEKPVLDERWKKDLGDRELFLFDDRCGAVNEAWGYARDRFTAGQFEQFRAELAAKAKAAARPAPVSAGASGPAKSAPQPSFKMSPSMPKGIWRVRRILAVMKTGFFLRPKWIRRLAAVAIAFYLVSVAAAALLVWLICR
jgi:hypothetical protein